MSAQAVLSMIASGLPVTSDPDSASSAAWAVGVVIGLLLTQDGRDWLRRPTLLLGGSQRRCSIPRTNHTMARVDTP